MIMKIIANLSKINLIIFLITIIKINNNINSNNNRNNSNNNNSNGHGIIIINNFNKIINNKIKKFKKIFIIMLNAS